MCGDLKKSVSSFYSLTMESSNSFDSAIGEIKILEVNQEGKYVRLTNEGKQVRFKCDSVIVIYNITVSM